LEGSAIQHGFVDAARIEEALRRATCLVLPSRREGYGLVVVEAAARATPSVVVAGEDNAASELIVEGVNGALAPSSDPAQIADAILRVHAGGLRLRQSTARWFEENRETLSLESSLRAVLAGYAGDSSGSAPERAGAMPSARS
jgi:glycosyltransferase involved in cell wall biosynthesis